MIERILNVLWMLHSETVYKDDFGYSFRHMRQDFMLKCTICKELNQIELDLQKMQSNWK